MPPSVASNVTVTCPASDGSWPGCQLKLSDFGGSQSDRVPQVAISPSAPYSTMRPPTAPSSRTAFAAAAPTEWLNSGHHADVSAVNASNARSTPTGTTTVFTNGEMSCSTVISAPPRSAVQSA